MRRAFLYAYRIREGKTQKEMAQKYHVTQQAWSGWERGNFTPDFLIMRQIAQDAGVPVEKIFRDVFYELEW